MEPQSPWEMALSRPSPPAAPRPRHPWQHLGPAEGTAEEGDLTGHRDMWDKRTLCQSPPTTSVHTPDAATVAPRVTQGEPQIPAGVQSLSEMKGAPGREPRTAPRSPILKAKRL